MNRDEADHALASLGAARDRCATTLYGIDSHRTLAFLNAGGLDGATSDAWATVHPRIDAAWTDFGALGDGLADAAEKRARLRPSDPDWSRMRTALERDLPAIAARLEQGTAGIARWLDTAGAALDTVTAAVAPITDAVARLGQRAADLGDRRGVGPLDQRATLAAAAALRDPLGCAPGGVLTDALRAELAVLAADVTTAAERIDAQARVRDGYARTVADLTARVDAVAAAETAARAALERALAKISAAALPGPPATVEVLRARIAGLDAIRARRDWRKLAEDVATVSASIAHADERAQAMIQAADGLIERRDELRGRLDAYRAKAARHRLDEDTTLSPLHAEAYRMLYTAPCDLGAATRAVHAYQRALTELTTTGKGLQ